MLDEQFFSFSINIISFFQKKGLVAENAKLLLTEAVHKDEYEIINRILQAEAKARNLDLSFYLNFIANNEILRPEIYEYIVTQEEDDDLFYSD